MLLGISFTFSQVIKQPDKEANNQNEWWFPILKKLNIEPHNINNYDNMFEMCSKSTNNNRIITLEDAFFLIKNKLKWKNNYYIVKSKTAFHDLDKKIITCEGGTMEEYIFVKGNAQLFKTTSFGQFIIEIKDTRVSQLMEKEFKVLSK